MSTSCSRTKNERVNKEDSVVKAHKVLLLTKCASKTVCWRHNACAACAERLWADPEYRIIGSVLETSLKWLEILSGRVCHVSWHHFTSVLCYWPEVQWVCVRNSCVMSQHKTFSRMSCGAAVKPRSFGDSEKTAQWQRVTSWSSTPRIGRGFYFKRWLIDPYLMLGILLSTTYCSSVLRFCTTVLYYGSVLRFCTKVLYCYFVL